MEQQHSRTLCDIPGSFEYYTKSNECESKPCQNGARCTPITREYVCTCTPGWIGGNCTVDVNECLDNNGGCDPLRVCENGPGYSTCEDCADGYVKDGPFGCVDLDECIQPKCTNIEGWEDKNGLTCSDYIDLPYAEAVVIGKMTCRLAMAMMNSVNKGAETECCACGGGLVQDTPCDEHTECINSVGNYSCTECPSGFTTRRTDLHG